MLKKTLFITFCFLQTLVFSNINYIFDISFSKKQININSTISFKKSTKYFIFNSINKINFLSVDYNQKGDTIFFKNKIKQVNINYSLQLKNYQLNDGVVILKNESKWYPIIDNDLYNVKLQLHFDKNKFFCITPITSKNNLLKNTDNITIILLPKKNYTNYNLYDKDYNLKYFFPHTSNIQKDTVFIKEFMKSFIFFDHFFNTQKHQLTVINIGSADFTICQSLKNIIVFGNIFYDMYKQMPNNSWIPHEVCHQWWGNYIFFDKNSNNYRFIEESVTEYLKTLYIKKKYNDSIYVSVINNYKFVYDYVINDSNKIAINKIKTLNNQVNNVTIYCKGTLILKKIEPDCIDNNFLSHFFNTYQNKIVSFDIFEKELKEKSSTCSLELKKLIISSDKFW